MERQRLMYTHLAYTWYVEYLVMYIEIETRSTHCLIMFTMFTCSRCACNSLVDIRKMVGSWQWFCLEGHQLWLDESTAMKERYSQKGIDSIHGAYFLGDLHLPQGSITNHMDLQGKETKNGTTFAPWSSNRYVKWYVYKLWFILGSTLSTAFDALPIFQCTVCDLFVPWFTLFIFTSFQWWASLKLPLTVPLRIHPELLRSWSLM